MKKTYSGVLVSLFMMLTPSVYSKDLIPLDIFVKFSQFQQLILSPTGEYMAAAATRSDNVKYVTVFDIKKMQQISSIEFKLGQLPSRLTWLNDTRVGIRIARKIGALDQPVSTPLYYAMNADGTNKDVLWGLPDKGRVKGPTKYSTNMNILDLLPENPRKILISVRGGSWTGGYSSIASYTSAYEMDVYTGKTKKIATAPLRGASFVADNNKNVRFAIGVDEKDNFKIKTYYRQNNKDEWQISSTYDAQQGMIIPIAFTADNNEIYATSNVDSSV